MSIRMKKVFIDRCDLKEIKDEDKHDPANQGLYVPSNNKVESVYGDGGGQTTYGGGQTAYDAGKTPMAVNTPQYYPTTQGYNDGGYGGTGYDDYYKR